MTIPNGEAMSGNPAEKPQLDKFRDLARKLRADEDEGRFEETVRKIAPKTPAPKADEE